MAVEPLSTRWSGPNLEMAYASPRFVSEKGSNKGSESRHTKKEESRFRRERDEDGKASSDGRNRRLFGSSDDDGSPAPEGFINHDFRKILDTHPLYRACEAKKGLIGRLVHETLEYYNITASDVQFVGRTEAILPPGKSSVSPAKLTALISAERGLVDNMWLDMARAIRASFQRHGGKTDDPDEKELLLSLVVEFLEINDDYPMYMFPVLEHEEIFKKWPHILIQVLDIHEAHLVSVGCYRRGRKDAAQYNPATVLILARPWSKIDSKAFRDDVVKILDRSNLPMVAVEIGTADHPGEKEHKVEINLDSLHGLNRGLWRPGGHWRRCSHGDAVWRASWWE
ncbi:hypothetical protein N7517_010301 [Penicillium concentricum]|uniref:Uncharacterized protein n=1 Tax=Penicillium concentricum TaxID=293559 RepID=A0A9W9USH0_9EURO|nr:uncharacterized protein N7517_010301 [Penicillium concentricum]KAJ5355692.1 hypothetical protein N7517_010301 [Penicillium concentricum]